MRALITGGKGFVGRHLNEHLLSENDDVTVIDLEHDVTNNTEMRHVMQDAQPDVIYHLAALSHVGTSWNDPSGVLNVNVLGTANVLAAAREEVPDALTLVISSAEVYGIVSPEQLPLTEDSIVQPSSPYAASKAAAEVVALQASRGFSQKVIVVRPFNHVGPGQAPTFFVPALANRLIAAKREGRTSVPVGELSTRRDFTDVRDVVRAYRLVATQGEPGETYNVASGVDRSMSDVAQMLLDAVGAQIELSVDLNLLRPVDVPVLRGDANKLRAATGWQPEMDFVTTINDVVAELVL
jgi:GDP-4-dehydro-6-deoxy-D-mannose reductase